MASSARIDELRKKFEENPRRYFAPLANEYRKAGDVEQAIAICREYLPQQPGHMSGHIVYGQALYEARQFEEAKTVFETALSLDPENLIALRHLGDIALLVADTDGARAWYRRVLEADPRNEEIQAQLASLDLAAAAEAAARSASVPTPVVGIPDASSMPTPAIGMQTISAPAGESTSSSPTVVGSPAAAFRSDSLDQPGASPPPIPIDAANPADVRPGESGNTPAADAAQPAASAATDAPAPPALELDSPMAGAGSGPTTGEARTASFSLDGLESTSLGSSQHPDSPSSTAEQTLSTAPTVEIDRPAIAAARETPAVAAPEAAPPSPSLGVEVSGSGPVLDVPAAASAPTPASATADSVAPPEPAPVPVAPPDAAPLSAAAPDAAALSAAAPDAVPLSTAPPEPAPVSAAPTDRAPQTVTEAPPGLELLDLDVNPAVAETDKRAPDASPFVTETMAELYLQQGHRDEALRVYRALLDQRPGDASLTAKIAGLQAATSASSPAPTIPASAMSPESARAFDSRSWEPTIRDVLGALAQRRPGSRPPPRPLRAQPAPFVPPPMTTTVHGSSNGPESSAPTEDSVPVAPSAPTASPSSHSSGEAMAPVSAPVDAISRLFDNATVTSADEGAARSLALAFAGSNGAAGFPPGGSDVGGAPARRASNELSLDTVFGGGDSSAPAPSSFSFDQFFSARASTQPPTGSVPPGSAGDASPDEVAQFTKWLEGLKQR